ncbi:hypothetical protein Pcinc_005894 [Petrolisthes cinctipes]|uniref:Tc1-like transposase DDE domain-containing protein n=1 Tax=Petrolisthes cinctipes TaxID=88211 RepID=A0AAE1G1Z5_PETCI|nr:hypothetical protein Pcinc_011883 [Petrolisthes cinctipes]KAK3884483.1 hypothetical protein Pcinc_011252 [Petrolisthes cinctipes]KAK3890162.1 hypothetical protein Pcinc_005894 [Petrolisthes cinctipes]
MKSSSIIPEETSDMSVWRLIHDMGFRYKTYLYVIALRALRRHREEGRQVVYLDETWFTTRMNQSLELVNNTQPATSITNSITREGESFLVVAAGIAGGFIENSFLCFPAKNTSGDYHGEMNGELFLRWLRSNLLLSLAEPLVLVIDNAPYHSQLTEESRYPTTPTKKNYLRKWMEHRLSSCLSANRTVQSRYTRLITSSGLGAMRLSAYHPLILSSKPSSRCGVA